jgi:hypothetical protein
MNTSKEVEAKGQNNEVPEVKAGWVAADGNTYVYSPPVTRACVGCRRQFEWDGSEYKQHCLECYKKLARKCTICQVNNVKVGAPKWCVMCTPCFLQKKSSNFGTCGMCPPDRANHLRRPLNKPACPECMLRLVSVSPLTGLPNNNNYLNQ